jgi:glycosyltransferase involved in cell wall biosynthesis
VNSKKYIYIVNVTRQLSIDMLNYFHSNKVDVHLITGVLEPNYAVLNPDIKVTYFLKYNNTSSLRRIYTWTAFTMLVFFYLLFTSKKKELILITSPPFIVFLGLFFKKIRNQKYHLIIWDLYPDALTNFNILSEKSLVVKCWRKINIRCFNEAQNIFTLGEHLSLAIKKYTHKTPEIIQNWVDTEFIKPMPKSENPFIAKYQLEDKFIVMYSGNMGVTHDIESIVYTAEILKHNTTIFFLIIGGGAKKAKIEKILAEKKLNNILLLPYQEKEILPYSLSSADVGVVTLDNGAESISVPSKTYYTLAAGSAIIALASLESELALLIEKYQCGSIFDAKDCQKIADYILYLSENNTELDRLKLNSRKASYDFTPTNAGLYFKTINSTV